MKYAVLLTLAGCVACGGSPAPAAKPAANAPTAAPKRDREFEDLIKRADAAVPKDAPDNQPLPPPDTTPPVVIVPGASAQRYSPPTGIVTRRNGYNTPSYDDSFHRPEKSEMEKMTEKAQRAFSSRIGNLSYSKQELTRAKTQRELACTGTTGARPVNGNISPTAAALPENAADSQQCRYAILSLESQEANYKKTFDALEIDAKRMGILPGVMRDLYAKQGFNPY
jgi:hypothetical protein